MIIKKKEENYITNIALKRKFSSEKVKKEERLFAIHSCSFFFSSFRFVLFLYCFKIFYITAIQQCILFII